MGWGRGWDLLDLVYGFKKRPRCLAWGWMQPGGVRLHWHLFGCTLLQLCLLAGGYEANVPPPWGASSNPGPTAALLWSLLQAAVQLGLPKRGSLPTASTDPSNLPLFHPVAVWSARTEERSSKCFPGLIISIKAFPGLRRGYTLQHAEQEMGSGFPKLPLPARANHKITGGQDRCARGFVCPRRN